MQIVAVAKLRSGKVIPLSEKVSTSFFRNSPSKVTEMINRYPNSWGDKLSWIATVPNWNSASTIETLNNYLQFSDCSSLIINSKVTGERLCVNRFDVSCFELQWG